MPTPVIEQIAERIRTIVSGVQTTNGYSTAIGTVLRPTRLPFRTEALGNLDAVITQGDKVRSEDNDLQGNPPAIAWVQPFEIAVASIRAESVTTALESDLNTIEADIQMAVMGDQQLQAMIVERHLGEPTQEVTENGARGLVTVVVEIIYRVSEDDPYENRAGA